MAVRLRVLLPLVVLAGCGAGTASTGPLAAGEPSPPSGTETRSPSTRPEASLAAATWPVAATAAPCQSQDVLGLARSAQKDPNDGLSLLHGWTTDGPGYVAWRAYLDAAVFPLDLRQQWSSQPSVAAYVCVFRGRFGVEALGGPHPTPPGLPPTPAFQPLLLIVKEPGSASPRLFGAVTEDTLPAGGPPAPGAVPAG